MAGWMHEQGRVVPPAAPREHFLAHQLYPAAGPHRLHSCAETPGLGVSPEPQRHTGVGRDSRESPARCPHRSPPHRFWHRHHVLYGDSKINKQPTLSRGQTQGVPEREGRGHSQPILRHTSSSHCHCHCHTPADGPAELLCWRSPSPTAVQSKPRIRLKYEVMGTA